MPRVIEIRHVPEGVHGELQARAARAGLSLGDYVLRELERLVARPTTDELLERIVERPGVEVSSGEIVAAVREARGAAGPGRDRDGHDPDAAA